MRERKDIIRALRGTRDLLPEEAALWTVLEDRARDVFKHFNFAEIRTPLMEESALFVRSIGEGTDIVEKQMYTFLDRGERSITLRPEATASVVRAYLENGMSNEAGVVKLFYLGPMFRAERPQAGRARQFHQIGVEAIGSYSPYLDAEIIILLNAVLNSFEIKDHKIKLNSLGCPADKRGLSQRLRELLEPELKNLCEDCILRYRKNVLRILDCKNENCKGIAQKAFEGTKDYLCDGCRQHFETVKKTLTDLGISYQIEPYLVRGLDYYTRTTFELIHHKLGAQDAIAAGGRYDNLVSELGGPERGACGFAIGVERTLAAINSVPFTDRRLKIFLAALGETAYETGFKLVMRLRERGISADIAYEAKSLKAQMRTADRVGARLVAIIGEDEIKNHSVTIRNMDTKEQQIISEENFIINIERILSDIK